MKNNKVKNFYKDYADKIQDKRFNSPYKIRKYAHRETYNTILKNILQGDNVLEIGCGEGILSSLMTKKGANVVATDISEKNLIAAKKLFEKEKIKNNIDFKIADAEDLPFADNSFDVVVADNVLEHLPHFKKGLSEIMRVMKRRAIIALPTCFNYCAWCLLGGDVYWKITRRTPFAIFLGFFRFLLGLFLGRKGVSEGYGGNKELPHLWRYPWVMKKELEKSGFKIISFEPATICLPYLSFLLPLIKFLDKNKKRPILKYCGFGSVVVLEKK